jgi:hypothetical protein
MKSVHAHARKTIDEWMDDFVILALFGPLD